jgi:hypothetical protein
MRRLAGAALVIVGLVVIAPFARPADAAPPSNDPQTAATIAATWLAHQVTEQGFIALPGSPSTPNLSNTAQAVLAFAAAGVGGSQVDAIMAFLGDHVDDLVVHSGVDDPGSLAILVLDAVAAGDDPTSFGSGHDDLVARLEATQQPDGLFGASDPTFDGAFRQGLALLALHAAAHTNASGADWLEDQQCDDGLWTAFRADTSVACPPVDPGSFTGPDTNSTALAMLGLDAQGRTTPATDGATGLDGVRNADGAWGFLAASDQPTDANSTGLVLTALQTVNGSRDAQGTAALLALQVGCGGEPADVGGVAFQAGPDGLVPDVLATVQAIPALGGVELPQHAPAISDDLVDIAALCALAPTSSTTTTTTTTTTVPPVDVEGEGTSAALAAGGSSSVSETGVGLILIGTGMLLVLQADGRRRRLS